MFDFKRTQGNTCSKTKSSPKEADNPKKFDKTAALRKIGISTDLMRPSLFQR